MTHFISQRSKVLSVAYPSDYSMHQHQHEMESLTAMLRDVILTLSVAVLGLCIGSAGVLLLFGCIKIG